MKHFYGGLEGYFDYQDIYQKVVSNAKEGEHFVEIGSFLGKSGSFMAVEIINSQKDIRFDCIDHWRGLILEILRYIEIFYFVRQFRQILLISLKSHVIITQLLLTMPSYARQNQ